MAWALQVLSFFDSVGFREMLKGCCTEVANLTAEELLQRYRAEAQVAELAHAARLGLCTTLIP